MQDTTKQTERPQTPGFLTKTAPSPFATTRSAGSVGQKSEDNRAGATPEGEDRFKPAETASVGAQAREQAAKIEAEKKPARREWKQITRQDIDEIAKADLAGYLQTYHGFSYVEGYKVGNGEGHAPHYEGHILRHDTIGSVSVRQSDRGGWMWTLRDGGASGVIWDFETWRYGGKKGDGIRAAYDNLGMGDRSQPRRALLSKSDEGQEYRSHAQEVRTKRTIGERIAEGAQATYSAVSDSLKGLRKRWKDQVAETRSNNGVNKYLVGRGIDAETQRQFKGQIGTELPWSRNNAGGATFAHIDLEGNVWNAERKGDKKEGDRRSFSQMSKGTKRLALLGDRENPTRIYVCESTIDGLSLYQKDGRPKGALIASTFGEGSSEGYRDLYELMKRHPNVEVHKAMDNDSAGRMFSARVDEIATLSRGDQIKTVDRQPAPQFKDWNDQIRGKVWTKEEKQVNDQWEAERVSDRRKGAEKRGEIVEKTPDQAAAALQRAMDEAERRRRKEEREASVSKGPSM